MGVRAMVAIAWLGVAAPAPAADSGLTVGLDPAQPPWAFVPGGDGGSDLSRIEGLDVDVLRALEKELGATFRIRALSPDQMTEALRDGRVDLVVAGWNAGADSSGLVYSAPYYTWGLMVAVRRGSSSDGVRGYSDLADRRVGYVPREWLERTVRSIPTRGLAAYDDPETLLQDLMKQRVQAAVHDSTYLLWKAGDLKLLRPAGERFTRLPSRIAVRARETELRDRLTGAIARLRESGALEAIRQRWEN